MVKKIVSTLIKRIVIIFCLLLVVNTTKAQGLKRITTLFEKQEYEKAKISLEKILEKDSINPGANYLSSILYLNSNFDYYNLDSGFYFVKTAIRQLEKLEPKEVDRLNRNSFTDSLFQIQKKKIDSIAFQNSLELNTVEVFNSFLAKHHTADQVKQATTLRNELAFEDCKKKHTYEAYKAFMDTYPDALQVKKAKNLYYDLLYAEKTKDGSLQSAEKFIAEYPESPFTSALLKNIFELTTADHQPGAYLSFIKNYPNNKYTKRAVDLWYYAMQHRTENWENASQEIPKLLKDSLQAVAGINQQLFIPFVEQEKIKFISPNGEIAALSFDSGQIDNKIFCAGIKDEIIEMSFKSHKAIYSRRGTMLFKGNYSQFSRLTNGFSTITKNKKVGLLHHAGWVVLEPQYTSVEIVKDFIKVEEDGLFGLKTMAGRTVLPTKYNDIYFESDIFVVEKDSKIALTNSAELLSIIQGNFATLNFIYDDYEILDNGFIKTFIGNREGLLSTALEDVIASDDQKIYAHQNNWLAVKTDTLYIYGKDQKLLSKFEYDDIKYAYPWLAVKQLNKWAFTNKTISNSLDFKFDSINLLNFGMIWWQQNENKGLRLANNAEISMADEETFQLLKSTAANVDSSAKIGSLILVHNAKKRRSKIFGEFGKEITSLPYYEFSFFDGHHLIVEKSGKKGIINLEGKTLIPIQYEAINHIGNKNFSLLSRGKIGMYNASKDETIKPTYSKALKTYNATYLIAEKSAKTGLINFDNRSVTPMDFDEITYWTDSTALVFKASKWSLYDIENDEFLIEDILSLKIVRDQDEKVAIFSTETGFGVLSNSKGVIIKPTFNDLLLIGDQHNYLYFCEKYVKEADWYVVLYYDKNGKEINKQLYNAETYEKIYCQQY